MPFFADAPEDSEEYLIYPQDRTDRLQIEQTEAAIRQILGPNALIEQIVIETAVLPKLMFWMSALHASQVEQIEKVDGVKVVEKDDPLNVDYDVEEDPSDSDDPEPYESNGT